MNQACDLSKGRCKPCEGGVPPLSDDEAAALLGTLEGWQREGSIISNTHAIGGLSENDFICAAKIDALLTL